MRRAFRPAVDRLERRVCPVIPPISELAVVILTPPADPPPATYPLDQSLLPPPSAAELAAQLLSVQP